MNTQKTAAIGVTPFVLRLALLIGLNSTMLRTELVVAATVFAVLVPAAMAKIGAANRYPSVRFIPYMTPKAISHQVWRAFARLRIIVVAK